MAAGLPKRKASFGLQGFRLQRASLADEREAAAERQGLRSLVELGATGAFATDPEGWIRPERSALSLGLGQGDSGFGL